MDVTRFKGFKCRWSKQDLANRIFEILNAELKDEIFTAGGFSIKCSIPHHAPLSVSAHENKGMINLPVAFEFKKPEGLFSVEGSGSLTLSIVCTFSFPDNKPHFDIELIKHEWLESPVVSMGNLDFPIEFLADFIIKRIRDKHLEKWVEKLRNQWDIQSYLCTLVESYVRNVAVSTNPDWYLNLAISYWSWGGFRNEKTDITVELYLEYTLTISDTMVASVPASPQYTPLDATRVNPGNAHSLRIDMSYAGLEKLLTIMAQGVNIGGKTFDIDHMSIRNTTQLELKLNLRSPVEGLVTMTGQPFFLVENQNLDITGLQVDVKAEKLLVQLTTPILEKFIRQRLEDILPYSLEKPLVDMTSTLKKEFSKRGFIFSPKEIKVQNMEFQAKKCQILLTVDNALISPLHQNWSVSTL